MVFSIFNKPSLPQRIRTPIKVHPILNLQQKERRSIVNSLLSTQVARRLVSNLTLNLVITTHFTTSFSALHPQAELQQIRVTCSSQIPEDEAAALCMSSSLTFPGQVDGRDEVVDMSHCAFCQAAAQPSVTTPRITESKESLIVN